MVSLFLVVLVVTGGGGGGVTTRVVFSTFFVEVGASCVDTVTIVDCTGAADVDAGGGTGDADVA